jgi:PAS domain S-box-containing protein
MIFEKLRIRQKLMVIILITCSAALSLMAVLYLFFEYYSFRKTEQSKISALAIVVASNSSAALAFDSPQDATEILSALRADNNIQAACLYDSQGKLFACYQQNASQEVLPPKPGVEGYVFQDDFIEGFQPVRQQNLYLGTLYIRSSIEGLHKQLRFHSVIALLLVAISLLLAYLLSNLLQKKISSPIMALEKTARQISEQRDYAVRAKVSSNDEIGALIAAFNHMLSRIEEQNTEIVSANEESTKLAAIVESSGDAIIGTTSDFLITSWNKAAERLLGFSADEMLNQPFEKIVAPQQRKKVSDVIAALTASSDSQPFETLFVARNRALLDISLTISPVKDSNGVLTGMSHIARNISVQKANERKIIESEEHLRLATQAAELGIFDMDLQAGSLVWDKRCRELFGVFTDEPVTFDSHFVNGLHEEDRERVLKVINESLNKEKTGGNYDIEYRTYGRDNKIRWVRAKGKAFFNEQDQPVRFIGSVLDITMEKLEEQRKNDFIAIISHELKTPLTTIKSYIQLLLVRAKKENDEFGLKALSRADTQSNKMSSMIRDFLSLARIEEGKLKISKEQFDLSGLLEEAVSDAHFLSTNYEISLDDCKGIRLYADREKIGQVLVNLISNAIKYSPPGSLVTVGCEKLEGKAKIFVKDRGIGISESDQEKLFTRFYRVEHEKAKTVSGFGIGLYLVSEILKYHESKIEIQSKEGEGSTFYFYLDTVS